MVTGAPASRVTALRSLPAVLAALTVCASPPAADARAPRTGPWAGEFRVVLTQTRQQLSWTYHHTASGRCDVDASGSGTEDSRLKGGSARVTVTGATPSGELDSLVSRIRVEFGNVPSLPGSGTVARQGTTSSGQSSCDQGNGGANQQQPPPPDCGTKHVINTFTLGPSGLRALLWQRAVGPLDDPFQNCPVVAKYGFPSVTPISMSFRSGGFGPGKRPVLLTGHHVAPVDLTDTTGSSTGDVSLKITPLGIAPALTFASRAKALEYDSDGHVEIPVACSSIGPCAGTVGIAVGQAVTPAGGQGAAPRYPAPLAFPPGVLGKRSSFKLRARQRRHLRVTIDPQLAPYLGGFPLVVAATERSRRAKPTFALATVELRPRG